MLQSNPNQRLTQERDINFNNSLNNVTQSSKPFHRFFNISFEYLRPKIKFNPLRSRKCRILALDNDPKHIHSEEIETSSISERDHERSRISELPKFHESYSISENIGDGSSATVYKCCHLCSRSVFAVKAIGKQDNPDHQLTRAEVSILKTLSHKNILPLRGFFEDEDTFFIVTPLYSGGDLMTALERQYFFLEGQALLIINQILSAVAHCHNYGVVHRDIKPENVMFKSPQSLEVVLIDFGLAKKVPYQAGARMEMRSVVGTPHYVAPEILNKAFPYNEKVDAWSIGVLLYTILCGFNPFRGQDLNETYEAIRSENVEFPSPEWSEISTAVKELIESLLRKDADERISVHRALCNVMLEHQLF